MSPRPQPVVVGGRFERNTSVLVWCNSKSGHLDSREGGWQAATTSIDRRCTRRWMNAGPTPTHAREIISRIVPPHRAWCIGTFALGISTRVMRPNTATESSDELLRFQYLYAVPVEYAAQYAVRFRYPYFPVCHRNGHRCSLLLKLARGRLQTID